MRGKKILDTVTLISVALVLVLVLLVSCENKIIYHPDKHPAGNWDMGWRPVEDVWFQASDGVRLHGWYAKAPKARATLLWFHGNAGNITHRWDNIEKLLRLGLDVFIFDYRGYGRSEGTPDEAGLLLDAEAAYQTLVTQRGVSPDRLILFGRSLGGVFASDVATKHPAAGLILESVLTSASDMAERMFVLPIGWAVRSKLDAINKVPKVTMPKLFLHGTEDSIIPYKLGRTLYDAAAEPKEFYDIQGAGHNDTYIVGGADYFKTWDRFIARIMKENKNNETQEKKNDAK